MRFSLVLCLAAAMLGRAAAQADLLAALPNCTVRVSWSALDGANIISTN